MRTETTCKNLINITSQPRHPSRYLLSCSHHSSSRSSSRRNNNKSIDTCLVCWLIHMRFSIFISKMTLLIGCGNRTFRIKYRSESDTYKHVILIVLFSFVFCFFSFLLLFQIHPKWFCLLSSQIMIMLDNKC